MSVRGGKGKKKKKDRGTWGQGTKALDILPDSPSEHKNLTFVQFPDTGCHYRMPKYPEEKFAVPLIIQMFSPLKC